VLRHGTLLSSGAVKGVSGLLSSLGGEFGLFQDDQQGCQGTPSCCKGILGVPLEPVQANQPPFLMAMDNIKAILINQNQK